MISIDRPLEYESCSTEEYVSVLATVLRDARERGFERLCLKLPPGLDPDSESMLRALSSTEQTDVLEHDQAAEAYMWSFRPTVVGGVSSMLYYAVMFDCPTFTYVDQLGEHVANQWHAQPEMLRAGIKRWG